MNNKFEINNYEQDEVDLAIIKATQVGLEITERPFLALSLELKISEEEICKRLEKMYEVNFVRKIAIATNHYKLGYTFNAMTVWEIKDGELDNIGSLFKKLGFASHCYERPKIPPHWNYNLFAMVHAKNAHDMEEQILKMKEVATGLFTSMDKIVSTKILKKTGIQLKGI